MGYFRRYITNENTNVRKFYKVREPPFLLKFPWFIEGFWALKLNFDWKELSTEFPLFRKVCLKYEARRLEFNVGIGGRNPSIYEKHLAISSFS